MEKNKLAWLCPTQYPQYQNNEFCVAEFKRELDLTGKAKIEISALARYMLFINGEFIGRGPHTVGGDFFEYGKISCPLYDTYNVEISGKAQVRVLVTSVPTVMCEYNFGASGLFFRVKQNDNVLLLNNGWMVRPLVERQKELYTDYTLPSEEYTESALTDKEFAFLPCDLEGLDEEKIYPDGFEKIVAEKEKITKTCVYFDTIYSAYPYVSLKCSGKCIVKMISTEEGKAGRIEEIFETDKDVVHFSPRMRSIGQIEIEIVNMSKSDAFIDDLYIHYSHYPVHQEGSFCCNDKLINQIYDLCLHTLKICRQSIHFRMSVL